MNSLSDPIPHPASRLARWTLAVFVLTFVLARTLVLLIMTRRMPDLFLYVGQTHVHHLNYGIFLLASVGAWTLFAPPRHARRPFAAVLYGIGLALTFDEFGMWLHLGGSYWQRASYDAVITLAALLALLVVAPTIRHFRTREWIITVCILAVLAISITLAAEYLQRFGPTIERIEHEAPQ